MSEVVIIGAGPGGLAAAIEAAKAGVMVTILDENSKVGGQIYRQPAEGIKITNPAMLGRDHVRGQRLLNEFSSLRDRIECLNEATVWGLFDDRELAFQSRGHSSILKYEKLIVGIGAYDRPVPFPGWTLPGVYTAGAALRFVKTQGVIPGERTLIAGTGPLQLVLAYHIISAGGKIEAVLEASDVSSWVRFIMGIWGQRDLLLAGWQYLRCLRKSSVPLLRRHLILEAHGDGQVEEAVIAEIDKNWRPKLHTRRTIKVDAICSGYGLVPSTELTMLAGCEHTYEPFLGGWIPMRSSDMATSVTDIYAVGDSSGVGGSQVAIEEGRVAGISVAQKLGYISIAEAKKRLTSHQKRLQQLNRFRKVLEVMSVPQPGLFELANDDTILCRCEELTLGDVKKALANGAKEINEIKRMTRIGMGRCQGRMCEPTLIEIMRRELNQSPIRLGYLNRRPPSKPIELGALIGKNT